LSGFKTDKAIRSHKLLSFEGVLSRALFLCKFEISKSVNRRMTFFIELLPFWVYARERLPVYCTCMPLGESEP